MQSLQGASAAEIVSDLQSNRPSDAEQTAIMNARDIAAVNGTIDSVDILDSHQDGKSSNDKSSNDKSSNDKSSNNVSKARQ